MMRCSASSQQMMSVSSQMSLPPRQASGSVFVYAFLLILACFFFSCFSCLLFLFLFFLLAFLFFYLFFLLAFLFFYLFFLLAFLSFYLFFLLAFLFFYLFFLLAFSFLLFVFLVEKSEGEAEEEFADENVDPEFLEAFV